MIHRDYLWKKIRKFLDLKMQINDSYVFKQISDKKAVTVKGQENHNQLNTVVLQLGSQEIT